MLRQTQRMGMDPIGYGTHSLRLTQIMQKNAQCEWNFTISGDLSFHQLKIERVNEIHNVIMYSFLPRYSLLIKLCNIPSQRMFYSFEVSLK